MCVMMLLTIAILSLLDLHSKVKDTTLIAVILGSIAGLFVDMVMCFFYLVG